MSSTHLRQSVLAKARTVVVKIGTHVLANDAGRLDVRRLGRLAGQIAELRRRGVQVTVVSSGAIGAGCAVLGLSKRPADVAALQAVAAVGPVGKSPTRVDSLIALLLLENGCFR